MTTLPGKPAPALSTRDTARRVDRIIAALEQRQANQASAALLAQCLRAVTGKGVR